MNETIFFITQMGVVKRCEKQEFVSIRSNGLKAIKLKDNDTLRWVEVTNGKCKVVLVTRNGQAVVFDENDVRVMGRAASGVRGIRLKNKDILVKAEVTEKDDAEIVTITENGYAKRTPLSEYRETSRGASGVKTHNVNEKTGVIVGAKVIEGLTDDLLMVSKHGTVIRVALDKINQLGRSTAGVRTMRLDEGDKIVSVEVVKREAEETIIDEHNLSNK